MSEKKQTVNVGDMKLDGDGFVSVIAQDYESGEVLLFSKMNAEALEKTFETGYAHYYCDKKKTVVKYGATLGNTQKLKAAFVDQNGTLLIKVRQTGKAAPEMGAFSCFSKQIKGEYKDIGGEMFGRLQRIVEEYKTIPKTARIRASCLPRASIASPRKWAKKRWSLSLLPRTPKRTGLSTKRRIFSITLWCF